MNVSFALHGIGVSGGIAIGRAQLVSHATLEVAHYTISPRQVPAEVERFATAVQEVQSELEGLHAAMTSGDVPGEFGRCTIAGVVKNEYFRHESHRPVAKRELASADFGNGAARGF